jgi:hypothetical protein
MSAGFDPASALPAWVFQFIPALRELGIVSRAAERAGVSTSAVSHLRNRSAEFDDMFTQAMDYAIDGLEAEAMRRAHKGVAEPIYYQGDIVGTKQTYSDGLLQFLLKGRRREVFGDKQEITGADGAPLQIDTTTRATRVSQLMALATQRLALTGEQPEKLALPTPDDIDLEGLV